LSYLKVCVFRSSSSGNCAAIWTARSAILVDCSGLGPETLEKELEAVKLDPSRIDGIVITHGHEDHISKTTFRIALRYAIPIYIHHDTYQVVKERYRVRDHECRIIYHTEKPFMINDLKISPFETFHNGGYVGRPFGFCVEYAHKGSSRKVGLLTDTSRVSDHMIRMLHDCRCLMIECNHDAELAWKKSPDQPTWKEHLNNEAAAEALIRIKDGSTDSEALKHIFLAHISERHNKARTLIGRISKRIRRQNLSGSSLELTYRDKRTRVREIL